MTIKCIHRRHVGHEHAATLSFLFSSSVSSFSIDMDEIAPEYDVVVLGTGKHAIRSLALPRGRLTVTQA